MIEKLIQGLGAVLKGLVHLTIKKIKINMFNKTIYIMHEQQFFRTNESWRNGADGKRIMRL